MTTPADPPAVSADDLAPGLEVEVDVGPVAHGGHCVARYDGRVIFVRLALPGERVIEGCGGCDFQHAEPELQRELKAFVVAEQLRRLAGVERDVTVEPLPGDGFGWRTRVRWALDAAGRGESHQARLSGCWVRSS